MKKSNILVLAIASVLAAGVAIAAPATAPAQKARVDANGDGVISRAEAAAHPRLAERFDQLDKNRDGRLDASERPQFKGRGYRGGGMAMLDANKDGVIDRAEAAKLPKFAQRFDQLDKNRDGRIDASERPQFKGHGRHGRGMAMLDANKDGMIDRTEAAKFPQFAQRFDQLDKNRDGRLDASERPQRMGRGGGMAKIDKNGDGRISRNEAVGSPFAQRFDQLDANRDGYITREEMRASFQKMREARATAPAVR
ncbi:hypothetical protein GCM10008101_15200 [Lysobacter xinjiangensis]|uniref:EF-hand domain-containing protein n=1 Tax=Cognatilysobacter xinjiangensis TaxID=546892 RepID=A0ABQ3C1Y6_9GAMM|nr:hypothetical protein [Lysobacter xinjiangensis]GGZ62026.1 hypothetical protein GCM10008101_15200 [Lysobacter xinjiangensis]